MIQNSAPSSGFNVTSKLYKIEFKLGAIHKRRLLRGGGRGAPLKADLLDKPIY